MNGFPLSLYLSCTFRPLHLTLFYFTQNVAECLCGDIGVASLPVLGGVHVDVDGGRGSLRCTRQGFCQA